MFAFHLHSHAFQKEGTSPERLHKYAEASCLTEAKILPVLKQQTQCASTIPSAKIAKWLLCVYRVCFSLGWLANENETHSGNLQLQYFMCQSTSASFIYQIFIKRLHTLVWHTRVLAVRKGDRQVQMVITKIHIESQVKLSMVVVSFFSAKNK